MSRGLYFDLDGTLADSHSMLADCFRRLLLTVGALEDGPTFQDMAAYTLPDIVTRLCKDRPDKDPAAILRQYEQWVLDGYVDVHPHEGAHELLAWARAEGFRVAVVTSAAEEPSIRWLTARGLMEHIELVVGRGSVTRTKPDPEPFALAVERTGCIAEQSAAVEDSASGAAAALGAGLPTYVLGPEPQDRSGWPAVTGFLPRLLDLRERLA